MTTTVTIKRPMEGVAFSDIDHFLYFRAALPLSAYLIMDNCSIMQTEIEKCMNGEWYDCHDPVFIELNGGQNND
jgi:hypothetical protein